MKEAIFKNRESLALAFNPNLYPTIFWEMRGAIIPDFNTYLNISLW